MDEKQINIEIQLADIRRTLVFVWSIMLVASAMFIDNILVSSLLVLGSVCPVTFFVTELIILRD